MSKISHKSIAPVYASRSWDYLIILILCIVGFGIHYPAFFHYFMFDDFAYIAGTLHVKSFSDHVNRFIMFPGMNYRPAGYILGFFLVQLFGLESLPYHASTVTVHILNSLLVYLFLSILLRNRISAGAAALLFVANTAYGHRSIWVIELFQALPSYATLLITCILFLRQLRKFSTSRELLAWACFIFSLFSYEASAVGVILLFLVMYCERETKQGSKLPFGWLRLLPYLLITIGYFSVVFYHFKLFEKVPTYNFGWHILRNVMWYLYYLFSPTVPSPTFEQCSWCMIPLNWLSGGIFLSLSVIVILTLSCRLKFLALWIPVTLAPFLLSEEVSGRYLYLATLGTSALFVLTAWELPGMLFKSRGKLPSPLRYIGAACSITLYGLVLINQISLARKRITHFENTGQRGDKADIVKTLNRQEGIAPHEPIYFYNCAASIPKLFKEKFIREETPFKNNPIKCIESWETEVIADYEPGYIFHFGRKEDSALYPFSSEQLKIEGDRVIVDWSEVLPAKDKVSAQ